MSDKNDTDETAERSRLHIVFIHLDLGIGGAEQLVLQLANASQDLGHSVSICTTRCDADHCFPDVREGGRLCEAVHIFGNWIPTNVLGKLTTFCSTLRMLYVTLCVRRQYSESVDLVVLDVLPTPIPLLSGIAPVLFYCHFPDFLLKQERSRPPSLLTRIYRSFMMAIEEGTMGMADLLVVNSKFTKQKVKEVFRSIHDHEMHILYPALNDAHTRPDDSEATTSVQPIVSLNRFERKKNIELLLQAYAELLTSYSKTLPPVIIAGGYDTQNVENVEYRGELQTLVVELGLQDLVQFEPNVQDVAGLFAKALCVVYTPSYEHFGIVPLEAMHNGTPVVACNNGGPMETIVDQETGFLCEPTPASFAQALLELVSNTQRARKMGNAGRLHVQRKFGMTRFQKEWGEYVELAIEQGRRRWGSYRVWRHVGVYIRDALCMLIVAVVLTGVLRVLGLIGPTETILGCMRKTFQKDEL